MKKTKNIERFKFYGGYTVLFTICMICTSLYFILAKLVDYLEKCLIYGNIRRFAD